MDILVMYNTIMALAAGAGLVGVALLGRMIKKRQAVAAEGWSMLFAVLGFILSITGIVMSLTWPLRMAGTADANILMGEPSAAFGLLLLAASFYLWQRRAVFAELGGSKEASNKAMDTINRTMKPLSIFVFACGLMLIACAASWIRFQLGAAPEIEPLSGYLATVVFANAPAVESVFLGIMWGLAGLGALLFPFALSRKNGVNAKIVFTAWIVAGLLLVAFGALNFYTHVGLITNMTMGTDFKI